jgi:hypothetical protein
VYILSGFLRKTDTKTIAVAYYAALGEKRGNLRQINPQTAIRLCLARNAREVLYSIQTNYC